jgi:hypothetical protein
MSDWTEWMKISELAELLGRSSGAVYGAVVGRGTCAGHKIERRGERPHVEVRAKKVANMYPTLEVLEELMAYYEDWATAPSTSMLARYMDCPVQTMHRRLKSLEADGYVVRVQGLWQVLKNAQGQSVTPRVVWEVEDAA